MPMRSETPVGAVIIGRNEGERLKRCISSVLEQLETVAYVDSGSVDGSSACAAAMGVMVVDLDMSLPFSAGRARNEGLSQLCGMVEGLRYVQFIDGDCELCPGWIDRAVGFLASHEEFAVVSGRVKERNPEASVYNWLCDVEWRGSSGEVSSSGGIFMARVDAMTEIGGFDTNMVAGEEPEMCYRLRRSGWRVYALDALMTLHDAHILRFHQWWTRTVRGGLAYAHGYWLHRGDSEPHHWRENRRIVIWAMAVPLTAVLATLLIGPAGLFVLMLYPLQFLRQYAHGLALSGKPGKAASYALFNLLEKFPQCAGQLLFIRRLVLAEKPKIIEYKQIQEPRTILYIAGILPARSETFVYREVLALRACGVAVHTASVHPPEEHLGSPELDALAASAIPVYGSGLLRLLADALREWLRHPVRAAMTTGLAVRDALGGSDLRGARRLKVLAQGFASLALARRTRPLGIVHIHAHMAHVPATIAMYTARQLGIGFSFTGHANDIFPNRALLGEKIERSMFVSCISRWHRDFYGSIFPKDVARLPVIRCGVDTDAERFSAAVHGDALRVLAVGRLVSKKGFDVLLEAVRLVTSDGTTMVDLTIAGSGPEEERLRSQAAILGPGVKVEMPGGLDNERVMELMAGCELFALPLRITPEGDRDGIPVVLMEAMARGRCVVSGDLPTIRELVEDGDTGFLVPTGDVQALVSVIKRLASDRSLLDSLGARAREKIVHEFDVNANARALLRVLEEFGPGRLIA